MANERKTKWIIDSSIYEGVFSWDTSEREHVWNSGVTPEQGGDTHNQTDSVCSRLREPFVRWSVVVVVVVEDGSLGRGRAAQM